MLEGQYVHTGRGGVPSQVQMGGGGLQPGPDGGQGVPQGTHPPGQGRYVSPWPGRDGGYPKVPTPLPLVKVGTPPSPG